MKNKKNIIKRICHRMLSVLFRSINSILCTLGIVRPKVIIMMDGGICSQMVQYLCGRIYKDVSVDVCYDTRFFIENGKDMDGKFERKLEFQEMFPTLPFATISMRQSNFYRRYFSYGCGGSVLPNPESIKRTTYFNGYYRLPTDCDFKSLIQEFKLNMRHDSKHLPKNEGGINCAVHVRRGDLANRETECYKSVQKDYFITAMNYVVENYINVRFCFFSDELDWVQENLCHLVNVPYNMIRGNKAWEDLALVSECDVVIASQGSFGTMGARLNGSSDLIVPDVFDPNGFIIRNFSVDCF